MHIRIMDSRGWEKNVSVGPKDLLFIGSSPADDICLNNTPAENASPVRPRQAQLLDLKQNNLDGKPMMRLINLSPDPITLTYAGAAEEVSLSAYVKADIAVGDSFRLNSYTLRLVGDTPTRPQANLNGPQEMQGDIGLAFDLANESLAPHGVVQGRITVRNNGPRKAAQFQISVWLDGAPSDICQLSTTSFALYPNASQETTLWVRHPCSAALTAAEHVLEVRVEAPGAYPNQTQIATRKLLVLPCFEHELRLKQS